MPSVQQVIVVPGSAHGKLPPKWRMDMSLKRSFQAQTQNPGGLSPFISTMYSCPSLKAWHIVYCLSVPGIVGMFPLNIIDGSIRLRTVIFIFDLVMLLPLAVYYLRYAVYTVKPN